MKRILLLILGCLFLVLCVMGLFQSSRLSGINLALIIGLVFFIPSVISKTTAKATTTADNIAFTKHSVEVKDQLNQQDAKAVS